MLKFAYSISILILENLDQQFYVNYEMHKTLKILIVRLYTSLYFKNKRFYGVLLEYFIMHDNYI